MLKRIPAIFYKPYFIASVLTAITLAIVVQSYLQGDRTFGTDIKYTHYNNYVIYKQSFFHLIENKDLYALYPLEHWDYYKYSPTFALLMAPLAYMPDVAGLFFWTLLNALVLFIAVWKLPGTNDKGRMAMLGFILVELITSLQNAQCNPMIAGLIVLAFILLEKGRTAMAALFIVLSVFIKPFGILGFGLYLFYPGKVKAAAYTVVWLVVFSLLPLLVVSPEQLIFLYRSWWGLLTSDHSASYGFSVMGWLHSWFQLDGIKNWVVVAGGVILLVPLLRFRLYTELMYRLLFLCSILIWMVIFNHKAESATFVIAVTGIAIWFFTKERKTIVDIVLIVLAFVFAVLSPTDIFPRMIRETYVEPYALKGVACILVWVKVTYDMMLYKPGKDDKAIAGMSLFSP